MGMLRSCPDWALARPAPLHDLKLITQPGLWIQTRSLFKLLQGSSYVGPTKAVK